MDENPYQAPREKSLASVSYLPWSTIADWIVIVILGLVVVALLLPDVDDSRQDVLRRDGKKSAAQPTPQVNETATQE